MDFFLKHCPQEDTLHGQRIGYVRVSSYDQNPERQLEQVTVSSVDWGSPQNSEKIVR